MMAEQKNEARVYLRRSETTQEMSLHDQLRTALNRAAELGVTIHATLADVDYMKTHSLLRYKDVYIDDGLKGDDLERHAFKQMCEELLSRDTVGWLFCVRRDRLGRPQDIGSFRMAITEADFTANGITLVFSDQIVTPAEIERDYFTRMLMSSVEYKGAGDFLVQHAAEDRILQEGGFEPLIPYEEWVTLVERSRRRGATQEGRQRPKKVDRYALGKRVYDQTDGCGYPLYGKMRDGKPEYMCGRYMKSRPTECHSNTVDGEQLTRFTLATLREQVGKIASRDAVRRRIEELARGETEQAVDPNQLARIALEAKATDLRLKLDQAARNIMEVENQSLIKVLENRYSEAERELAATVAEIAKLPPPADPQAADIDSEVEATLVLCDEIERLAEMPMANEAINAMLERIGLRIGLYFEEGRKGTRPVRKVARGIIALSDFPLPVPPYGEARVLPTAALDAGLQRRLAAELDAVAAGRQRGSRPRSQFWGMLP